MKDARFYMETYAILDVNTDLTTNVNVNTNVNDKVNDNVKHNVNGKDNYNVCNNVNTNINLTLDNSEDGMHLINNIQMHLTTNPIEVTSNLGKISCPVLSYNNENPGEKSENQDSLFDTNSDDDIFKQQQNFPKISLPPNKPLP